MIEYCTVYVFREVKVDDESFYEYFRESNEEDETEDSIVSDFLLTKNEHFFKTRWWT